MKSMNDGTRQTQWFPKSLGAFQGKVPLSLFAHIVGTKMARFRSFQPLKSGEKTNKKLSGGIDLNLKAQSRKAAVSLERPADLSQGNLYTLCSLCI